MDDASRRAVMVLAWVATMVGAVALIWALFLFFSRCGDTCSEVGRWWHHDGAWQWKAQLALAGVGFTVSGISLRLLTAGHGAGLLLLAFALVAEAVWVPLVLGAV